jgi:hypothetical protein
MKEQVTQPDEVKEWVNEDKVDGFDDEAPKSWSAFRQEIQAMIDKSIKKVDYCSDCGNKITEADCAYNVCNNCRLEV